jgi:hypothetical protein
VFGFGTSFGLCFVYRYGLGHSSLDNTLSNTQQTLFSGKFRPYTLSKLQKHWFQHLLSSDFVANSVSANRTDSPTILSYNLTLSITNDVS